MSDASEAAPAPRKTSLVKRLIPVVGGLVVLGAATGGGIYLGSSGLVGGGAAKGGGGHGKAAAHAEGETTYVPIESSFTANVRDSDAVMQIAIGVSTHGGEEAAAKIKELELPIRSAVLLTLSSAEGDPLLEDAGKRRLAAQLTRAINGVLAEKAGETRIDAVYFTSFLIQ